MYARISHAYIVGKHAHCTMNNCIYYNINIVFVKWFIKIGIEYSTAINIEQSHVCIIIVKIKKKKVLEIY